MDLWDIDGYSNSNPPQKKTMPDAKKYFQDGSSMMLVPIRFRCPTFLSYWGLIYKVEKGKNKLQRSMDWLKGKNAGKPIFNRKIMEIYGFL
jgi:hypothetical protein